MYCKLDLTVNSTLKHFIEKQVQIQKIENLAIKHMHKMF